LEARLTHAIREQKEITVTEIHLSEQDLAFIEEQVKAGTYENADAVVAAGLRLLDGSHGKLVELQRLIQEGLDNLEAGRVVEFASGEELVAEIKRMAAADGERGNAYAAPAPHPAAATFSPS
jgi:antitoxin ParD1/3/4